jgi:hypothetical protein
VSLAKDILKLSRGKKNAGMIISKFARSAHCKQFIKKNLSYFIMTDIDQGKVSKPT